MKLFLALLFFPLAAFGQIPTPDPLATTLPNGKVVHFQTAEQKAKFEAALAHRPAPPVDAVQVAEVKKPAPLVLGHAALDQQPSSNGKVNPNAPPFTADYYMAAPETWVGKQVTLAVAYLMTSNETKRADGMRQFTADTWNRMGDHHNMGGLITVLAPPDESIKLLTLCGTSLQYNGAGIKTILIKGEFSVLTHPGGSASGAKEYAVVVSK